jgi:hypothetical protein
MKKVRVPHAPAFPLSPSSHIGRQQPLRPQGRLVRVGAYEDERRQALDAELRRGQKRIMRVRG